MVEVGDHAPDFTAPLAGGEAYNHIEEFSLSDALGGGPIVLAFYPAAFTSGCTEEMCAFRDTMDGFEELDASVYGVSVDLPFSQNVWIEDLELNFPMLSDWEHEIIEQYGVVNEGVYGMLETAERSVFVVDADGVVTYKWVREGDNPEFAPFVEEVRDAVADARLAG